MWGEQVVLHKLQRDRCFSNSLYKAEARDEVMGDGLRSTVRRIAIIYVGYTVAAIVALLLTGVHWWEAVTHGMTGISTGGFTVTRDTHRGYPPIVKLVTMATLAAGAFSFSAHYALWRGRWRWVGRQSQFRTMAVLLGGA